MTKIFMRYNPFTVETEIQVNDKEISSQSKLYTFKNERLQVWLDQLIPILREEWNEDEFEITFHGTALDYEDVKEICGDYPYISLEHILAKDSSDKIIELNKLFQHMQEGPFEDLKDPIVKYNFEKALNSDFEVAVIATMSSGKSTLINAMLGRELMPSKNEACTATIVNIKDIDEMEHFRLRYYDSNGTLIEDWREAHLDFMKQLNDDPNCSRIEVEGDIQNISSQHINLVLADTPGPNNARDDSHRDHTYRVIKNDAKPMVLYVLNGTQLSTNDDSTLLKAVAEQAKVGGKQSKDRFIFAVNKIDQFDPEKGENIEQTLKNVRIYLEEHGIHNPNIYPVSAEMAKVIRMQNNGFNLTRSQRGMLNQHDLFTEEPTMQMVQYTPLSNTAKRKIYEQIEEARAKADVYTETLYHSGIPAIEQAINEYLEKYAVTAKITNAVNSFKKLVEEKQMMEQLQKELVQDENKRIELGKQMGQIESQLEQGKKAKEFKKKIQALSRKQLENETIKKVSFKFEKEIREIQDIFDEEKISFNRAESIIKFSTNQLQTIQSDIMTDIEKMVSDYIHNNAEKMIHEYISYVEGLISVQDMRIGRYNQQKIFTVNVPNAAQMIQKYKYSVKSPVREEAIKNLDRKWYTPWRPKYKMITVYEEKEYVDGTKIMQELTMPFKKSFYQNLKNAEKQMDDEAEKFKKFFLEEFERLESLLTAKVRDLKELSQNQGYLLEKIQKESKRKEWLDDFIEKLDSILEI